MRKSREFKLKNDMALNHWVDEQLADMLGLVTRWAEINSHTFNLFGLKALTSEIVSAFSVFNEEIQSIVIPPAEQINNKGEREAISLAPILTLSKRPKAARQVLFVCHMDTVFFPESTFQKVKQDGELLKGPGVTDAKGGIVVMLKALEALEQSPEKKNIGWQVIINTDEEIGSPGSAAFLMETARRFDFGLVFEPCLPDGSLVGARKGSGNFTLVVRGVAAHAGRHHDQGKNAIEAAAECIYKIAALNNQREGLTVNVGMVNGGTALNVVPDLALIRFNVRIKAQEDEVFVIEEVKKIIAKVDQRHGVGTELHGKFFAAPKILDQDTRKLSACIEKEGRELGMDIKWQDSGGVCDGNRLAAAGLPTVDTMGVRGGGLHSDQEYLEIASLAERVKLTLWSLLRVCA